MTRLIDAMCWVHRAMVLGSGMWPAGNAVAECPACSYASADLVFLPGVDGRQEIAIHEAGHAVTALRDGLHVQHATIASNGLLAGHTNVTVLQPGSLDVLTYLWAGSAAVRVWLSRLGILDDAAQIDVAQGARTDAMLICSATADGSLIEEARKRAEWIADRHFARIERVAEALLAAELMTGEEIDAAAWG